MRIILLTGGTGFVGGQILKILQESDFKIRLVIRSGTESKLTNMKGIESVITTPNLFSESSTWWETACKDVELVIHSAWYAEPGKYLQSEKNIECLIGTMNLARGAAISGVKKFVGIGSCFEYDLSYGTLSTLTPLKPETLYSSAKVACFYMLNTFFSTQNISFAWCRLFYLFGEGEDTRRFVPYLHMKLSKGEVAELTSGEQIRDYLDIKEAAKLIVTAALGEKNGAINICSGIPQTIKSIALAIATQYGRPDLLKFGAREDNLVDPPIIVGSTH